MPYTQKRQEKSKKFIHLLLKNEANKGQNEDDDLVPVRVPEPASRIGRVRRMDYDAFTLEIGIQTFLQTL